MRRMLRNFKLHEYHEQKASLKEHLMTSILIVDDDETIRDTLYDLFSSDYLCHAASTAEQALSFIQEQSYDLVLTDISMPGLSGLELIGTIRQRQPDTLVIVITGISDHSHAQGLIRLGAFDYILKPFRLEEVEARVAGALETRRRILEQQQRAPDSEE